MHKISLAPIALMAAMAAVLPLGAAAETVTVDARQVPLAPVSGQLKLGEGHSVDGHVISVNNQYLMRDGKPWMPVMGEFHYTRFPHQYWEEQLLKMKAAGVEVVSTYVIWQHHEDKPGQFDFSGDRDLRAFVELCKKHGLYVYLRPGPWAHAEVRFGGLPDWVVETTFTRSNDPQYLADVSAYYQKVAEQTKGLLWKDGGPIIGLQIENEYNRVGPLQGRDHIAALKAIALKAGFDVPLYSVTGWDNAIYPQGEAIPVFGSYVDEPWGTNTAIMPPKTSYAFQYGNRPEYGLGAVGGMAAEGDANRDLQTTPFFGAEYGAGVPTMYRRRPIIRPDDIAAMVTAKIGSGVNLLGYYMFQGGQNPQGTPSREESTAIGGYNDLPKLGYDFGAPLGEYGEAHPVLSALRPAHAFLNAFGDRLAPMPVRAPAVVADALDLKTLRWSARSDGHSAFVFVNNYVRQYDMAGHTDVRFQVALADRTVTLPPVDVRNGDYFIWPVGFDLSGITLAFATAQPFTKISDAEGDIYVFAASSHIPAQLAFAVADKIKVSGAGQARVEDGHAIYTVAPGSLVQVRGAGHTVRVLVVSAAQAKDLSAVDLAGHKRLVLTAAEISEGAGGGLDLRQIDNPAFRIGIFPALPATPGGLKSAARDGVFQTFTAALPVKTLTAQITPVRAALKAPSLKMTGPGSSAVEPMPEAFGASATWTLTVPANALSGVDDVFVRIGYEGDVARLFSGPEMIDDQFYNGPAWDIGLKRYASKLDKPFTLSIMPLREDAQIMLDATAKPKTYDNGQVARVNKVTLLPEYLLKVRP